jgi:outer membrane protein
MHPATLAAAVLVPVAAAAAVLAPPAAAQQGDADRLTFTLSAGAALAPEYDGADEVRVLPLLFFRAERGGYVVESDRIGIRADLLPSRAFVLGPILRYEPGRDDVDDRVVDRLPDVDDGVVAGVQAAYVLTPFGASRDALRLGVDLVREVAGGDGGTRVTPSVSWSVPATEDLRLTLGASATWASEEHMDARFGIDARGAAASGLRRFDADAGIKDVGLTLVGNYAVTDAVGLTGIFGYSRLLGDAADSPVVSDRGSADQLFMGAAVGYRF